MRSMLLSQVAVVLVLGVGAASVHAEPKNKAKVSDSTDKSIDKQMAWENKEMGEDSSKQADMKKIAAAQKLAEEARKHPAPEPAPKVKDPNKEGVRAKQEASIGLPIASEEEASHHAKKASSPSKKTAAAPNSGNDELGALVASSLASDKSGSSDSAAKSGKGKGKHGKAGSAPSSLDLMFANQGN